MPRRNKLSLSHTLCGIMSLLCSSFVHGFIPSSTSVERTYHRGSNSDGVAVGAMIRQQWSSIPLYMINESSGFSMEEIPLSQIFQKAVMLQRSGDRSGALNEYQQFLKVAKSHDVDPMLYSEVHANMGAIYAMQGKNTANNELKTQLRINAKESFKEAVNYRPSLGSAWVNLALLTLAEGKELGNSPSEQSTVGNSLKEARQCCERALGMDNDDEQSRALANKLVVDIDSMMKQMRKS